MNFLFFLLFPIFELILFVEMGQRWGWINSVLYIVTSAFVGLNLLKSAGLTKTPSDSAVRFVAGILFIIPGAITDLVAMFLLFPPTRKVIWWLLQRRLAGLVANSNFKVYSFGADIKTWSPQPQEREARIIDVTPLAEKTEPRTDR